MSTPRPTFFSDPEKIRYNLTCQNGATYTQLCTDKNFNIKQCNESEPQNRYNTIFCNCKNPTNMYESKAIQQNGSPMPIYTPDPQGNMPTNTQAPPPGKKKFYTGRYCQYSDNKNCSGNGVVDYTGKCTCNPTYYGDYCEFSNASHCNGRGTPNVETVNGRQEVKNCSCIAGVVGNKCQFTKWNTCNGNGDVKVNNSGDPYCDCYDGFGGVNCEFTNARCNNNGKIKKGQDACDCNPGFDTVDINKLIKDGMPTPIPRPTGHCNDCAPGKGPWKKGDPTSCSQTWFDNRPRLTKNCYYYKGGKVNCNTDPDIKPILDRGDKIHSLSDKNKTKPDAYFSESCETSWNGACRCSAGKDMHKCLVSGYFNPNETEQGCHNNWRGYPSDGAYSCPMGTSD